MELSQIDNTEIIVYIINSGCLISLGIYLKLKSCEIFGKSDFLEEVMVKIGKRLWDPWKIIP
jgi:hypothetical protein